MLTLTGIVITKSLFSQLNSTLLIGIGMLIGPLGLLLVTGTFSYLFKGTTAQTVIFFSYTLLVILWGVRYFKIRLSSFSLGSLLTKPDLLFILVIAIYLYLFYQVASTFDLGGDVDVYFSIATSFARGNYPSYLSWQPRFLTGYHMGAFMVEGVIFAVTSLSIYTIHCAFSAYIISALFLLITGLTIQSWGKSIITLLPAIFGLISFGLPVILVSGFQSFSFNLKQLNLYPLLVDFKGSIGGGTGDFLGLFYRNFYPFALATFILSLYSLALYPWKSKLFLKYMLAVCLLIATASIDESLFLLEIIFTGYFFIVDFFKNRQLRSSKKIIVLVALFIGLFLTIQNAVRDSLLDPALEGVRFKILIPSSQAVKSAHPTKFTLIPGDQQFMQYFNSIDDHDSGRSLIGTVPYSLFLKNFEYLSSGTKVINKTTWFLPNMLLITILTLIISLTIRSKLAILLSLSALFTSALSVFIVYTFFPPTSVRFANQTGQFVALAAGFIIIDLFFLARNYLQKLALTLVVLVIIGPQLLSAHARAINSIIHSTRHNFTASGLTYASTFNLVSKSIPSNARLIFLDGYPITRSASGITAEAIPRAGFFVPISPPDFKSVNTDASSEWVDAMLSLNPPSLKQLGVDYIFAEKEGRDNLNKFKVNLDDTNYFKLITQNELGQLYQVTTAYKDLPNQESSIAKLLEMIPKGSRIYLDRFSLNELRRGLVLRLAKKTTGFGPGFSAGGDYFMYIETFLPFTYICEAPDLPACEPKITKKYEPIDYIITEPQKDIRLITNSSFSKFFVTPLATVWKRS